MIFQVLGTLLSHWRRRPFNLLALIAGLALATALWSAVQAINGQARENYAEAAAAMGGQELKVLRAPDGSEIDQATFIALRQAGWRVSPVMTTRVTLGDRLVSVIGRDAFTAPPGL